VADDVQLESFRSVRSSFPRRSSISSTAENFGGLEGRPIRLDPAPFDLVDGGEVTLTQWFYVGPA